MYIYLYKIPILLFKLLDFDMLKVYTMMMQFSTLHNMATMVSGLLSSIRSISTILPRSAKLYRTPTMTILVMMIIMSFTFPILSSSANYNDTSTVANEVSYIIQHDEPTIHSIGKWSNDKQQQEDHSEGMNHLKNDIMITSKEVAVIHHRMTQTQNCVYNQTGLQNAVNAANYPSSSNATIITICANIILYMTSEIIIGFKYIQFNCDTSSNASAKCTLDAQARSRHFTISSTSRILFKNLIFMNGNVSGKYEDAGSLFINGGASIVDIIECDFINNVALNGGDGGAIVILHSTSNMINVTLRDNKSGSSGGAINMFESNVTMINTIMTNNTAVSFGGAVYSYSSNLKISDNIVTNNTAPFGGGISSYLTNVVVTNSTISSNTAQRGGAFYLFSSRLIVRKSNLSDNTATINGTYLYSWSDNITMTDSVIYNNNPKDSMLEESRIQISGNILLHSQSCHFFANPNPSPTIANPSLMPKRKPSAMPSIKPSISKKPPSAPLPIGCVTDEAGLQSSVRNIPNRSLTATTITLCAKYIAINVNEPDGSSRYSGINLINKFVNFQCMLANATERCVLDAQQQSRHFYIRNTTASFDGIIFMNGNVKREKFNDGGSLYVEDLSTIIINDCDFIGGVASAGGAIYALFSVIQLANVNLMNNNGGAISAGSSEVTMINGLLNNNKNNFGGAIDSVKSTITMKNVDLINNIASDDGGAIKSHQSAIVMSNVLLSNNSALKDGGVISSRLSNVTMSNVVMCANQVNDGTISLLETNINLQRVSFAGAADVDKTDLLIGTFNPDDQDFRYSKVNLPQTPPPPQTQRTLYFNAQNVSESSCINNCTGLIDGVKKCNRTSNGCDIYVCSKNISCSQSMFAGNNLIEYGIDVSNKDIVFHCVLESSTKRCILDGSSNTRLFYGSNTNVEFRDFIFANGYDSTLGGGMKIQNNSVVKLLDCTFLHCNSPSGAAVFLSNTQFLMEGAMSSIVNNTGSQTSFAFFSSDIELYNIHFSGNDVSFLESDILIYNSTIKAANLSFDMDNNKKDCEIFVAMYPIDITKKSSCIGMGLINNDARTTNSISISQKLIGKQSDRSSSCSSFSAPIVISQPFPMQSPPRATPSKNPPSPISQQVPIVVSQPSPISQQVTIPLQPFPLQTPPRATPSKDPSSPISQQVPISSQPFPMQTPPRATPSKDPPISQQVPIPVPAELPTISTGAPLPISPPVSIPVPNQPPTIINPTRPPHCLSGENILYMKNIGYKRLDECNVGDYIESGTGDFTQIYGFGHMDPYHESEFIQLHYQTKTIPVVFSILEISPKHLVQLDQTNKTHMIRASNVVIGDTLNGMVVTKIQKIVRRGLYAPLTYSGDFMVKGVIVSNYVDLLDHDWIWSQHTIGHILFFPQRIFCGYFTETCKKEKYIDGYGYLAYIIIRLGSFAQQSVLIVKSMILLVPIGFFAGVIAYIW